MDNIKWLFFDVGYTLINEDKCHEKRIQNTVERFQTSSGITYDSCYAAMVKASREYKPPYLTALKTFGIEYYEPYDKELEEPYEQAASVLKELHNRYKIGVIANQSAGTAGRLMDFEIMDFIDLVMSSAEEGFAKPDIRFFKEALQRAGCTAGNTVMIGDRLDNDIFPAKRVGMTTIWIKQGFGGKQIPISEAYIPDYIITDLSELMKMF